MKKQVIMFPKEENVVSSIIKKTLSLILVIAMFLTLVPTAAFAANTASVTTNKSTYYIGETISVSSSVSGSGYTHTDFYLKTSTVPNTPYIQAKQWISGANPSCTFSTSSLSAGTYYIYAVLYNGDALVDNSKYAMITVTSAPKGSVTSVSTNKYSYTQGETITANARVTGNYTHTDFYLKTSRVANTSYTLAKQWISGANPSCTFSTSSLSAGTYYIYAVLYNGDTLLDNSQYVEITVNPKPVATPTPSATPKPVVTPTPPAAKGSVTSVSTNKASYTQGETITASAKVTGTYTHTDFYLKTSKVANTAYTQAVQWKTGANPSCEFLTSSLSPGTYYIYAVLYNGDTLLDNSQYVEITVNSKPVVTPPPSATPSPVPKGSVNSITTNKASYIQGEAITVSARVTGTYTHTDFYLKTSTTANEPYIQARQWISGANPSCTFSTSSLSAGTYYIYAVLYNGDALLDNSQYATITITAPPKGSVTSVWTSKPSYTQGETIIVSARVTGTYTHTDFYLKFGTNTNYEQARQWISGANPYCEFSTSSLSAGTYYIYAVLYNGDTLLDNSQYAEVTVNPNPTATPTPPATPSPVPKVSVNSVTTNKASYIQGESIIVSARVIGNYTHTDFYLKIGANANYEQARQWITGANPSCEFSTSSLSPGKYNIYAVLYNGDTLLDNSQYATITVNPNPTATPTPPATLPPAPKGSVTPPVSTNKLSYIQGEAITVSARVTGNYTHTDFYLKIGTNTNYEQARQWKTGANPSCEFSTSSLSPGKYNIYAVLYNGDTLLDNSQYTTITITAPPKGSIGAGATPPPVVPQAPTAPILNEIRGVVPYNTRYQFQGNADFSKYTVLLNIWCNSCNKFLLCQKELTRTGKDGIVAEYIFGVEHAGHSIAARLFHEDKSNGLVTKGEQRTFTVQSAPKFQILEGKSLVIHQGYGRTSRESATHIKIETTYDWRVCVENSVDWIDAFTSKNFDGGKTKDGTKKELTGGSGTYDITFRYTENKGANDRTAIVYFYYNVPGESKPREEKVTVTQLGGAQQSTQKPKLQDPTIIGIKNGDAIPKRDVIINGTLGEYTDYIEVYLNDGTGRKRIPFLDGDWGVGNSYRIKILESYLVVGKTYTLCVEAYGTGYETAKPSIGFKVVADNSSAAVTWISAQIGGAAKDYYTEGAWKNTGTQCVDLNAAYIVEYFKLTLYAFGDGHDVYKNVCLYHPSKFTRIDYYEGFIPQPGDIISLVGSDTRYGHVALVESVNGNVITIAEQYDGSITILRSTFTITNDKSNKRYICGVARPQF